MRRAPSTLQLNAVKTSTTPQCLRKSEAPLRRRVGRRCRQDELEVCETWQLDEFGLKTSRKRPFLRRRQRPHMTGRRPLSRGGRVKLYFATVRHGSASTVANFRAQELRSTFTALRPVALKNPLAPQVGAYAEYRMLKSLLIEYRGQLGGTVSRDHFTRNTRK